MSQDPLAALMGANFPKTVDEMRDMLDGFAGLLNAGPPEIGAFHEAVPFGDVTADIAVPTGPGPHPVLVYFHGGGWVCGSPATHRKLGMRFAEGGYLVFNVDYRLAPEHPFPTPFEDCVAAVHTAVALAGEYGGDPERLALGGDSAGGNLAAAVAGALAQDATAPDVKAALLIYGVFDFEAMQPEAMAPAEPVSEEMVEAGRGLITMMVEAYLGAESALARDPRVSPLHVAEHLPPSHVVVGSADPLAAQAESLVERLRAAGVEHEHFVDDAMPHGYLQMEMFPASREAQERMLSFLGKHL